MYVEILTQHKSMFIRGINKGSSFYKLCYEVHNNHTGKRQRNYGALYKSYYAS